MRRTALLIGGGLVVGAVLGFVAGSLYTTRQVPGTDLYRATLTGAVVGGVFAILGGAIGSGVLLFFEGRRVAAQAQEEYIGAVVSVKIGLEANYTAIEAVIRPPWTGPAIPAGLVSDARYLSAERLLAARLPAGIFSRVSSAYAMVPLAIHLFGIASGGSLPANVLETLTHIASKTKEADDGLGAYIDNVLKVKTAGR